MESLDWGTDNPHAPLSLDTPHCSNPMSAISGILECSVKRARGCLQLMQRGNPKHLIGIQQNLASRANVESAGPSILTVSEKREGSSHTRTPERRLRRLKDIYQIT
jgi:hypothetical protein